MRRILAVSLLCAFATGAHADGPSKWTGFYIGAHAGGAFNGNADYDYLIAGNFEPVGRVRPTDLAGFMGGGHLGFNYQIGSLVLGVEGTVSLGDLSDTLLENACPCPPGNDYKTNSHIGFLGTATGRLGLAVDRMLIYGKGGWAFTTLEFDASFRSPPASTTRTSIENDFDRNGWVAGVGVEFALTRNWVLGIEYNHMDFGSEVAVLPVTNSGITTEKVRSQLEIDTVMARASYKFGN